jgi:hypothetical protein
MIDIDNKNMISLVLYFYPMGKKRLNLYKFICFIKIKFMIPFPLMKICHIKSLRNQSSISNDHRSQVRKN